MKRFIATAFYAVIFISFISSCTEENEGYEIASPRIIVSNPIPSIGEEVLFYYETDISGSPQWNFGDGLTSNEAIVTHVFSGEGSYHVYLEFSDGKGGKSSSSVSLEVMGKRLTDELLRLLDNPSEIWICAHRANTLYGKQNGIPENSIEAIQNSIEAGADIVEIDVRVSADDQFVLMHDATLSRTTNASGNVSDKTLAELKSYKLRDANGKITSHTIPTLEEALLAGRGMVYFNLDKVADISNRRHQQKLVALVDSLNMFDRVLFYVSGNSQTASGFKNANPESIIFPWASTLSSIKSWSSYQNTNLIQLNYQASDVSDVIAAARANRMVSYSNLLNHAGDNQMLEGDFSNIEHIKSLQVQVVQTDYIELVKSQL